jgi:hypothetical protein
MMLRDLLHVARRGAGNSSRAGQASRAGRASRTRGGGGRFVVQCPLILNEWGHGNFEGKSKFAGIPVEGPFRSRGQSWRSMLSAVAAFGFRRDRDPPRGGMVARCRPVARLSVYRRIVVWLMQ